MKIPTDILTYLATISIESKEILFKNSVFATALLKVLDELTVKYIFDLLTTSLCIPNIDINKDNLEALRILKSLNLIDKQGKHVSINGDYRKSLLKGFCDFKNEKIFIEIDCHDKQSYNETFASDEHHCIEDTYENILHMIVSRKSEIKNMEIKKILLFVDIIDHNLEITNTGFEFLLKTRKDQLWILILATIKYIITDNTKYDGNYEIELIESFFELSLKKMQRSYLVTTNRFNIFLDYLHKLGILKMEKNVIYLPELFRVLFTHEKSKSEGFLIIETNFKFYAYTTSKYDESILSLFCNLKLFLPGLLIGCITEESVNKAFEKGITASQINHYIQSIIRNDEEFYPRNVIEMVGIWENKKNRIVSKEYCLFYSFLSLSDFKKSVAFCRSNKIVYEAFEVKRLLFVEVERDEEVKLFVREHIKKL